jgi:hypothetical protein
MPAAEYMRAYRKRPGVRERELKRKREYDQSHRAENRKRWAKSNKRRKKAKAAWYQANAKRLAEERRIKRAKLKRD